MKTVGSFERSGNTNPATQLNPQWYINFVFECERWELVREIAVI